MCVKNDVLVIGKIKWVRCIYSKLLSCVDIILLLFAVRK